MRQICWRLVPRMLGDAKERRVDDSSGMVDGLYLQSRSICVSGYLTRELYLRLRSCYKIAQSKHPDSPRPGIAWRSQINKDYFLTGLGSSGRGFVVKGQVSSTDPTIWQRLATKLSFILSAVQNLLSVIFVVPQNEGKSKGAGLWRHWEDEGGYGTGRGRIHFRCLS